MNSGNLNTLGTLWALLPGLLTFLIIRFLTERERKLEATEAILLGLGYTVLINFLYSVIAKVCDFSAIPSLSSLSILAICLGFTIAWLSNEGLIFKTLRSLNFTQESSWRSIWVTALKDFEGEGGEHVFLYMKDGGKIMGALKGYSSDFSDSHLALTDCYWIDHENEKTQTPGTIIIPTDQISTIQLLTRSEKDQIDG